MRKSLNLQNIKNKKLVISYEVNHKGIFHQIKVNTLEFEGVNLKTLKGNIIPLINIIKKDKNIFSFNKNKYLLQIFVPERKYLLGVERTNGHSLPKLYEFHFSSELLQEEIDLNKFTSERELENFIIKKMKKLIEKNIHKIFSGIINEENNAYFFKSLNPDNIEIDYSVEYIECIA